MCRRSSVAVSGGYSLVVVCGLLIAVGSLAAEHCLWSIASGALPLEHWLWSTGSGALAQYLCMDLVAPWHVRSSWIRYRTYVSFLGRQILYH